jgi:hypothetical protein
VLQNDQQHYPFPIGKDIDLALGSGKFSRGHLRIGLNDVEDRHLSESSVNIVSLGKHEYR